MIMKAKSFLEMASSHVGSSVPVKYNGEVVGKAIFGHGNIMIAVDKYESELKRAINNPGLSGFSIEIMEDKSSEKIRRY